MSEINYAREGLILERDFSKGREKSDLYLTAENGDVIRFGIVKVGENKIRVNVKATKKYRIVRAEKLSPEEINRLEKILQNGN